MEAKYSDKIKRLQIKVNLTYCRRLRLIKERYKRITPKVVIPERNNVLLEIQERCIWISNTTGNV